MIIKSLNKWKIGGLILGIGVLGVLGWWQIKTVRANERILSSRLDFENGVFNNVEYNESSSGISLKSDGSWVPKTISTPHLPLTVGTAIASDGEYVYVLVGRQNYFMRYKPGENKWQVLETPIKMPGAGASMTVLGDYIYVVWGEYQRDFSKYSIKDNTWSAMPNLPALTYGGASIETDGTNLFILRGYNTTDFWKFDMSQNNWALVASTPASMYYGTDLVYHEGFLYTPRGGNSTSFYQYDIANNTWITRANTPIAFYDDHNMDVVDGYIYGLRDRSTTDFYRYNISANTWQTITEAPATTRYGGVVYNEADDMLYVVRGNNTYDIWKFDVGTTSFLGPAWAPNTFGSGADLIYSNGDIFSPRGNGSATFYKYTTATDSWSSLSDAPSTFNDDTKGVLAGSNLYFFRGGNTNTFWIYNIGTSVWSVGATAPATVRYGGGLAYPGSGDYIYAIRGNYTGNFWRYSITGDSWGDVTDVEDLPDNAEASYGARLVADESNSNVIYYLSGSRTGDIYKYEILENRWTDIGDLPYAAYWGTDAVYWNSKIYVQAGYYETDFWEFDLTAGDNQYTWRKLDDLSNFYGYERGPYNGASLEVDSSGNMYSTWGQSLAYMQMYVPSVNKYVLSGSWISEVTDLSYVKVGSSMTVSVGGGIPVGVEVLVQTKTSSDNVNWGSWENVNGEVVVSETNRYIQVKLILSGDTNQTPIVNSIEIGYQGDEDSPINPSTIDAFSREIFGSELSSGQTYNYLSPFFVWSGETDVDTGVEGYYVYFGIGESADPELDGVYQTKNNYLVSESMENDTYYLKIKTKDTSGNVSQTWDAFEYVYEGLEYQNLSIGGSENFLGETESVIVDGDQIKLESRDGFWSDGILANTPAGIYYGGDLAYSEVDNKLFLLRGANTNNFYIYDMALGLWSTGAATPTTVTYGGAMTEGPPGFLYAFQGNLTTGFWKYEISTDSWSVVTSAPGQIRYGSSLTSDKERYVYALKGDNGDAFWRYDAIDDEWAALATTDFGAPSNQVNNLVSYGGDLSWDGDDTIYAIQGNLRSGFAAYSILTDEWTPLPNLPALAYAGAEIEYDRTSNAIYFTPANQQESIFKYDVESQTWSSLGQIPSTVYYGCSMKNVNGKIYMTRGYNSNLMYSYNISASTWSVPNRNLFSKSFRGTQTYGFNSGSSISKGENGDFFIAMGNNGNAFYKWNEGSGEVTELLDMPTGVREGGDTVYVPGDSAKVYAVTSAYNRKFYEYNVATNRWTELVNDPPPVDPGTTGSFLTYDGDRYIYWSRGNSNAFYRYDLEADEGSRWTQLENITGALGWGGEILYKDGYVYALRGAGQSSFYRFNVGTTTWQSALANVPATVNYGGFMANGDSDSIYACRGTNTDSCYKYKISTNEWETVSNFPSAISYGGAGASNGTNKIYVIGGTGTNTFSDGLYTYVMNTDNSAFVESGSYISQSHDLSQVYRFSGLNVTYESADNTNLLVYSRTSADGFTWDEWTAGVLIKSIANSHRYKINSSSKQYIQFKFELSSGDGVYSGVISDYTIDFYQDVNEPSNHSRLTLYEAEGSGTTLASGEWNNSVMPVFNWPEAESEGGASDTTSGSGVAGYYVYFGIGETVDPMVLGTYTTGASFIGTGMTSGQTYYFRMKVKDNANNVSSEVGTTFVYKFDNSLPENPSTLVVDPPGYTATNSFNFSWTEASDADSQIAQYCYKTGEVGSTDTCILDLGVSGIEAYKTGTNTFYLRAMDEAGNFSNGYITGSYYWSSVAPGAPQNLQVGSSSNTVNEFSFSWAPPTSYYGQQSALRYYYSINALPTENNVNSIGLAVTYLSPGAYATQKGKNTLYVVAKDEAGNIDYNTYAEVDFYAETESPGMPVNLDISDVSIKETSSWRLALSWDEPVATGSGVAAYKVYRSGTTEANCSTDMSDFDYVASTTQVSYVDTGLTQSKKYYCVKACDSTNECSAPSGTVSLYPDGRWRVAPSLETEPSSTVKTKSALVNWVTSRTSSSFVKYGKSSGDYGEEVGSSTQVIDHEISLTGLDPGTTYYYKVLWTDEDGNTGESSEFTLSTNPAPVVSGVRMSDIGMYSAYVNFTLANATQAKVLYGLTSNYGGQVELTTSTASSEHTVKLENLEEGIGYHLKIVAEDEEGNIFSSDDYEFETLPVPKISGVKIQQVRGASTATVRLTWESNTSISSIVNYYKVGKMELNKNQIVLLLNKKHEMFIKDLSDDSDYVFRVEGKDLMGNAAEAISVNFRTSLDLRAPVVSNLKTESNVIGVGDEAKGQITVSWDTDEESTAQVEFDQGTGSDYPNKTQEQDRMSMNHVAILTDLKPGTVYHLRVIAKDLAGNEAKSYDSVVITPSATKAAINLVIESLSKSFGFFGSLSEVVK